MIHIYCNNKKAVYYDAESKKYVCNSFANADTRAIVSDLQLTPEGTKMLKMGAISPTIIYLSISMENKVNGNHFTYGHTENNGAYMTGKKGYYKGKKYYKTAFIKVYLKSILKDGTTSDPKHSGITVDQTIGAIAGHELTHAANPIEVNKDIKFKIKHPSQERPDTEIEALKVERIICDQSRK